MHKKIILLFLSIIITSLASAQKTGIKKVNTGFPSARVKKYKEYVMGIGAANFLGDVGGANQVGTHFIKDLNFSATRPSAQLCMRYKFDKYLAIKGGLYYQLVSGSDALTTEPFRQNRNISFRSIILEASVQGEFYFTQQEQNGRRYKIKNARGVKNFHFDGYFLLGIGVFGFNPRGEYEGKWYNLQPLSTEGEGLPGGPPKYSRVSVCVPYGIGVKNAINKDWSVGLEFGFRKTFTDYIDDVSGVYYNNAAILAAKGPVAAYFADPSLYKQPLIYGGNAGKDGNQTGTGQERGDPTNMDAYFFVNITVAYKIPRNHVRRHKY